MAKAKTPTPRMIAKAFHHKTYRGKPCSHGHCERYVTNKKCVICSREKLDEWLEQQPARKLETMREWRARNKDKIKAHNIQNYTLNGAQQRANQKKKRDTDPAVIARREARRRLRELVRSPTYTAARNRLRARRRRLRQAEAIGSHTLAEELALLNAQNGRCAYCGRDMHGKYTVDHIIPLLHEGTDYIENIALACLSCNDSKGTKTLEEWLANGTRRRPLRQQRQ